MRYPWMLMAALMPALALAYTEPLHEGKHWRDCTQDSQCVIIQGTCDLTAVTNDARVEAVPYYKQQAAAAKCSERFWKPKDVVARCHLGGCETISKQPAGK